MQDIHEPTVLILSGVRGDTQRYRSFHTYEQLMYAGVPCELAHITHPRVNAKLDRAELVILHRVAFDLYTEQMVNKILDRGGLVIGDFDDLVFDPAAFTWIDSPDFKHQLRADLYREDMHRYRATLEACQAVITSTEFLAKQARTLGKPAWVHRNAFSLEMLTISEAAYKQRTDHHPKVIIGYASGTPTHDKDFEVAKSTIRRILERYPHTELWLIGPLNPGEDWGKLTGRINRRKRVAWRKLPEIQAQFDINLAPLVMDNPFGQSKSEIKYMEAALVRVPTVASPTGAFAHAIRSGDNGFLAENTDEWFENISRLIEDPNHRKTMADHAFEDVQAYYHPSVRAIELITIINQIYIFTYHEPLWDSAAVDRLRINAQHKSQSSPESLMDLEARHTPSLASMALYSLQHRGAWTMSLQAWVYLRRLVAPLIPYSSNRRIEQ